MKKDGIQTRKRKPKNSGSSGKESTSKPKALSSSYSYLKVFRVFMSGWNRELQDRPFQDKPQQQQHGVAAAAAAAAAAASVAATANFDLYQTGGAI